MLPVPPQGKYSWMQNNFCYWVKAISIAVKISNVKEARFYWRSVRLPWAQLALGINHLALTTISAVPLGPVVILCLPWSSTSLDPIGFPLNISPNSSTHLHRLPVLQCSLSSCLPCFASYTFACHKGLFHDTVSQTTQAAIPDTRDWVTFISHSPGGWEVWN